MLILLCRHFAVALVDSRRFLPELSVDVPDPCHRFGSDCVLFVLRHPKFLACVYLSDIIITVMPRLMLCQFGVMYFCIVSPQ
jgi:hypothetical protein